MADCHAGQTEAPTDCDRHSEHHWCATCRGFYGVPHHDMHAGTYGGAPHDGVSFDRQCVCRMCINARAAHSGMYQ